MKSSLRSAYWDDIVKTAHVVSQREKMEITLRTDKHGRVTKVMYPMSVVWRSPVPPAYPKVDQGPDGFYPHDCPVYDQDIPLYVQTQILGDPKDRYPGLMERLRAEAEVVIAGFEQEVKRKLAQAEKRRLARFTGKGARARIDKIVELIARTLKGVGPDLDAHTFHKVIRVHSRARLVSEDQSSNHFLRVDGKVMAAMADEGLEWADAARTIASFGSISLIAIFHHVSSNPGHWELVTEDDVITAVRRAFVTSVMET